MSDHTLSITDYNGRPIVAVDGASLTDARGWQHTGDLLLPLGDEYDDAQAVLAAAVAALLRRPA